MIIALAINGTEESYFSPPPSQESCFQENGIVKVAIARDHHTYPFWEGEEVKLMELMFSERGVAFLGRVGHLGWIFELDGRFWQRGRVRHHSDREAYTLPSDLVPSWHPKSRRFPLVARQRGRGECTWANRLGVRKLQLIEALLLSPLPSPPRLDQSTSFPPKYGRLKSVSPWKIFSIPPPPFFHEAERRRDREREGGRENFA